MNSKYKESEWLDGVFRRRVEGKAEYWIYFKDIYRHKMKKINKKKKSNSKSNSLSRASDLFYLLLIIFCLFSNQPLSDEDEKTKHIYAMPTIKKTRRWERLKILVVENMHCIFFFFNLRASISSYSRFSMPELSFSSFICHPFLNNSSWEFTRPYGDVSFRIIPDWTFELLSDCFIIFIRYRWYCSDWNSNFFDRKFF